MNTHAIYKYTLHTCSIAGINVEFYFFEAPRHNELARVMSQRLASLELEDLDEEDVQGHKNVLEMLEFIDDMPHETGVHYILAAGVNIGWIRIEVVHVWERS